MNWFDALLLGVLQGVTEFLPVSSSGHLVLLQTWLGLPPGSEQMLAFDVVSHVGTVLAAIIVFRHRIRQLLRSRRQLRAALWLTLVATAVTGVIGIAGESWFKSLFSSPAAVGVALVFTGVVLFSGQRLKRPRRRWADIHAIHAAIIGLAQALAIIPGVSRSGMTICAAMLLGIRRRWAAELSFLIATPAILGATGLEILDLAGDADWHHADWGLLLFGGAVSCVTGCAALKMLLRMLHRARLHWFSYYLWIVGAGVLLTGL